MEAIAMVLVLLLCSSSTGVNCDSSRRAEGSSTDITTQVALGLTVALVLALAFAWRQAQEIKRLKKSGSLSPGRVQDAGGGSRTAASMTPAEKAQEKARLQTLVKQFAKDAVKGIDVSVIDPTDGSTADNVFLMDGYLKSFQLRGEDGKKTDSCAVTDVVSVWKNQQVAEKLPSLSAETTTSRCVGLQLGEGDNQREVFLFFDSEYNRDVFYTCIKILRLSTSLPRSGETGETG
ncbi:unnamed protein product [Vitrella brassicaformis CCMP3155]|uniref:Uncharacterized protein n=1 Tax=Vitrella brassicaformis (strain CCMP3155) TaxID=1169540 RepID=A0A0G4EHV5_VITBC|nr:unnamed protein product [Vitrella brassicaformis CCMP3155]|eukprot:CEL95780.1 unnamed protein product [Vitrella brassicaformis CCMP3155]